MVPAPWKAVQRLGSRSDGGRCHSVRWRRACIVFVGVFHKMVPLLLHPVSTKCTGSSGTSDGYLHDKMRRWRARSDTRERKTHEQKRFACNPCPQGAACSRSTSFGAHRRSIAFIPRSRHALPGCPRFCLVRAAIERTGHKFHTCLLSQYTHRRF